MKEDHEETYLSPCTLHFPRASAEGLAQEAFRKENKCGARSFYNTRVANGVHQKHPHSQLTLQLILPPTADMLPTKEEAKETLFAGWTGLA